MHVCIVLFVGNFILISLFMPSEINVLVNYVNILTERGFMDCLERIDCHIIMYKNLYIF